MEEKEIGAKNSPSKARKSSLSSKMVHEGNIRRIIIKTKKKRP